MQSKLKQIEQEKGKPMKEILQAMYDELGSLTAIADKLGVSQGTVSLWCMRYGLQEKRTLVEREAEPA